MSFPTFVASFRQEEHRPIVTTSLNSDDASQQSEQMNTSPGPSTSGPASELLRAHNEQSALFRVLFRVVENKSANQPMNLSRLAGATAVTARTEGNQVEQRYSINSAAVCTSVEGDPL